MAGQQPLEQSGGLRMPRKSFEGGSLQTFRLYFAEPMDQTSLRLLENFLILMEEI